MLAYLLNYTTLTPVNTSILDTFVYCRYPAPAQHIRSKYSHGAGQLGYVHVCTCMTTDTDMCLPAVLACIMPREVTKEWKSDTELLLKWQLSFD